MSKEARMEIQAQLLQLRAELAHWIESMPASAWDMVLPGPGLPVRRALARIVQQTDFLSAQASAAANKRSFLNYPQPILRFFERQALIFATRRKTPSALAESFQQSFHTALILLEDIPEEEWENGAKIMGRYLTVEQVYREYLEFLRAWIQEIKGAIESSG